MCYTFSKVFISDFNIYRRWMKRWKYRAFSTVTQYLGLVT